MNALKPPPDAEARVRAEHPQALRVWLRLFSTSQHVERMVRARLRSEFGTTLPRFDLMAQLERHRGGMKMRELSERLMVTGGNVTAITDQLATEGWVERIDMPGDRRAFLVRLTPTGRKCFARMARAHEAWVASALGGLGEADLTTLHRMLGQLKTHAQQSAQTFVEHSP